MSAETRLTRRGRKVRASLFAPFEVQAKGSDLNGTKVDVDPMQVSLEDQLRNLRLRLQVPLPVHLTRDRKHGRGSDRFPLRVEDGYVAQALWSSFTRVWRRSRCFT